MPSEFKVWVEVEECRDDSDYEQDLDPEPLAADGNMFETAAEAINAKLLAVQAYRTIRSIDPELLREQIDTLAEIQGQFQMIGAADEAAQRGIDHLEGVLNLLGAIRDALQPV